MRRLLAPAFTPRALKLLEARFETMVDDLLDEAEARGGMDVVTQYAARLPVQIVGDMLGIPEGERGPLRDWSLAILGALEPVPTQEALDWGNRSVAEFSEYLAFHIARYRRGELSEGGEVLGMLVADQEGGEQAERRGARAELHLPSERRPRDHDQPHRQRHRARFSIIPARWRGCARTPR